MTPERRRELHTSALHVESAVRDVKESAVRKGPGGTSYEILALAQSVQTLARCVADLLDPDENPSS